MIDCPESARLKRWVTALLVGSLVVLGACSPAVEEESGVAAAEVPAESDEGATTEDETTDEPEPVAADVDCEQLFRDRGSYSAMANNFAIAVDQAELELMLEGWTVDEMKQLVEAFRPHQDVEPEVFGPLREGLDNMSTDIASFEAGTFAGATGESYKSVSIVPVLAELGC